MSGVGQPCPPPHLWFSVAATCADRVARPSDTDPPGDSPSPRQTPPSSSLAHWHTRAPATLLHARWPAANSPLRGGVTSVSQPHRLQRDKAVTRSGAAPQGCRQGPEEEEAPATWGGAGGGRRAHWGSWESKQLTRGQAGWRARNQGAWGPGHVPSTLGKPETRLPAGRGGSAPAHHGDGSVPHSH